jgi:hypothetical protein
LRPKVQTFLGKMVPPLPGSKFVLFFEATNCNSTAANIVVEIASDL